MIMRRIRRTVGKSRKAAYIVVTITLAFLLASGNMLWAPSTAEAAITARGTASTAVANNATTISLTLPAGVLEGDLLLATVATSTGTTITPPAGWTRVSPATGTPVACVNGTNSTIQVWWKVAAVGEAGPYSFNLGGAATYGAGGIMAYVGVDSVTPIDSTTNGSCTTGSGTALSATAVTTNSANAWVIGVWGQRSTNGNSNTITAGSSMTNRVQSRSAATVSCGILCTQNTNEAAATQADVVQAAAGSSGAKSATSSQTGTWVGYLFALRPAVWSYSQSGYRWFSNVDSADYQQVVTNPSASMETINGSVYDSTTGYIYSTGYDAAPGNNQWRITKRLASTSEFCTQAVCGTQFGTGGVVSQNPTAGSDQATALALDATGGYLYVAGFDSTGANEWRIEKRLASDGSLVGGFGTGGVVTSNPTANDDQITAMVIDATNGYLYAGGYTSVASGDPQWRIEKRSLTNGNLCTAAECGTQFGTAGVQSFTNFGASKDDRITAMGLDVASGALYAVGNDGSVTGGATRFQWRVEKRQTDTGALVAGFGTGGVYTSNPATGDNRTLAADYDVSGGALYVGGYDAGGTGKRWRTIKLDGTAGTLVAGFGTSGVVTTDPTTGDDMVEALVSDAASGYLYLVGIDSTGANQWRIEKRQMSNGALVSGFASAGTLTFNPSSGDDQSNSIALDSANGYLFAGGYDSTPGNGQWHLERINVSDGSRGWPPTALASQNTKYNAKQNQVVRLRLLLHISPSLYSTSAQSVKLQVAAKSGTCDTAGVGESYADLTTNSGAVRLFDNPSAPDNGATLDVAGDPTHGSDAVAVQAYEKTATFTNRTTIPAATDGLWDFSIQEDGSTAFGGYCFKTVKSDGSSAGTPTVMPELAYCDQPRSNAPLMRHGSYFCNGGENRFYWSR